jgi:hypothetical protein
MNLLIPGFAYVPVAPKSGELGLILDYALVEESINAINIGAPYKSNPEFAKRLGAGMNIENDYCHLKLICRKIGAKVPSLEVFKEQNEAARARQAKAIIFDWFGVCAEKWIDVWERELGSKADKRLREAFFRNLDAYADNSISGPRFLELVLGEIGLEPEKHGYLLLAHGNLDLRVLKLAKSLRKRYKTALLSDNFSEVSKRI